MSRRLLLLGAALLLALSGTGLVFSYVAAADARALAGQESVRVLVVTEQIPAGTTGKAAAADALLETRELPRAAVPAGALTTTDAVAELVTSTPLHPGEFLLKERFTDPAVVGALTIPDGLMAVSVELTDPGRVAGFVRPGSEVAVFDTFEQNAGGTNQVDATRVLLPRVKVLAAGPVAVRPAGAPAGEQPAQDTATTEPPVATSILTLAVDQAQAEKLVHAAQTGRLYFALLTSASRSGPSAGTTTSTLFQ